MRSFWSPLKSKLAASLILLGAAVPAFAKDAVVEAVMALVNEEPIYLSEFNEFRQHLKQGVYADDLVIPNEETRQKALKDSDFLLEKLIQSKVIDSEIKKLDIQVTSEQIEQEIRKIAGYNNISITQMTAELRRQGFAMDEYRKMIAKNLRRKILIEREVTSKVKVSEDEIANYIDKNFKGEFSEEIFNYDLSHILISTKSRSRNEAMERARQVLEKIKEGGSFEELAADYSEDPNFSPGGRLGQFHASELTSTFRNALGSLNSGEVSEPVSSPAGIHLLKIVSKTVIPDPRFEALKQRAQEELYSKTFQSQFEFWMRQRRAEASVRVNSR